MGVTGGGRGPVALTIAGSDSGGGAGVAADLKTFDAHGVWGTVAVTAVTAQNTCGVVATQLIAPEVIAAQIAAVTGDIGVDAAKTGMLGSAEAVRAVATAISVASLERLVVDPVVLSKHGDCLLTGEGLRVLCEELLPLATVVTPNLPEASALLGVEIADRAQMVAAAAQLLSLGPSVVLLKGGHLMGDVSPDLVYRAEGPQWLEGPRIDAEHTHGTGCVLSAAVTAALALGQDPLTACITAKQFVTGAIRAGRALGHGVGPVEPGWRRP